MFSWLPFREQEPEFVKTTQFKVAWYATPGHLYPSTGIEMTELGLTFQSDRPVPGKEFDVQIDVHERQIHARVSLKHAEVAGRHHKYRCEFQGISADDYDCIMRFIMDLPEPTHEGSYYDPNRPDDDYRLLPMIVQRRIFEDLVSKGKLEMPPPGIAPLLKMQMQGETKAKNGDVTKRIAIHSRICPLKEEPKDFESRYLIDVKGNVIPQ